jgi:hypothetical protein
MQSLERYQGHFYNWYDTQSLAPLSPRYISSVDSGNLAGHLLTLRAGLLALSDHRIIELRIFAGLVDTARVLLESLGADVPTVVAELARDLDSACDAQPPSAAAVHRWLTRLSADVAAVVAHFDIPPSDAAAPATASEAHAWVQALSAQCEAARAELGWFAPWLQRPDLEPLLSKLPALTPIPTLHELAQLTPSLAPELGRLRAAAANDAEREFVDEMMQQLGVGSARAEERMAAIEGVAAQCEDLARMDFGFLYDRTRHLFAVGYNVDERQPDSSFYELLECEARF